MEEINLLQNRIKDSSLAWEKRNKTLVTILVLALILELGLTVIFSILNGSVQKQIVTVRAENTRIQNEINSKDEELTAARAFQAPLKNLVSLVDNNIHWTGFFDRLTERTYLQSQYLNLQADTTGKVHVEGIVSSYTDLGKLLLALSTSEDFTEVNLLSTSPASGQQSGYNFSLDLMADQKLYSKP